MSQVTLRLCKRDHPHGSSGWDPAWRKLLSGLGIYTQHRDLTTLEKQAIVETELTRFDASLVSVGIHEVIISFPSIEKRTEFMLVWG